MNEPEIRDAIHVNVEYFDGQEEGDVGNSYYVASRVEITATTDGETLDELIKNIHEMIDMYLKDINTAVEIHLLRKARIVITAMP
jgi:predicted RNase H-like HicB family nuclease